MKMAVIGGGLTGLTTAYRLSQNGHQVDIFEKERQLGGLAASIKKPGWDWPLDNFYHHYFTSDRHLKKLLVDLGLENKLFYLRPKTSIFSGGKISQLDSPLSLLTSPEFKFASKIRAGLATAYLKTVTNWRKFEKETAWPWLKKYYGNEVFDRLWRPLLEAKFGAEAKKVSLAWFWARIKKRSTNLGYLEGGTQILVEKLESEIKKSGGQILKSREFQVRKSDDYDRVIFTTPASVFLKTMGKKLPRSYFQSLSPLKMLGAISLVLELKKPFLPDGTYWLNINEKGFPFVAVVEHTNFIDKTHYGNHHILYVGGYYPHTHRYFKMKKEEILKEFLPFLQKINPDFNFLSAIRYSLIANGYAQPVVPVNYSKMIPAMKTPLPRVYLANMQMVYPWDRGVNYAVEMGERAAKEVLGAEGIGHRV